MTSRLITGIGELVTNDPGLGEGPLGLIKDAAIILEDDRVAWVGVIELAPACDEEVDVKGAAVVPGFVDSHSHLVFAGDRTSEFESRMMGRPYAAGGIMSTVRATRAVSEDALLARACDLAAEMVAQGTTTVEIKSGYGLTVADEAKQVRIASRLSDEVTFLGAHVVPPEFRTNPDGYVDLVVGEMLSACAPHCRWIDVFCEEGAFDVDQARRILVAGRDAGLGMRLHAAQLGAGPGVQMGVELGVTAIDHCTFLTDDDVTSMADAGTIATLLPGAEFSTAQPYPSGRRLLDAGVRVALACDTNPGSSFTSSMPFCMAIAVREMGLTPGEALWSATAGGAAALGRSDIGGLAPGQRADLVVLRAPSYLHFSYRPGVPLVGQVYRAGQPVG